MNTVRLIQCSRPNSEDIEALKELYSAFNNKGDNTAAPPDWAAIAARTGHYCADYLYYINGHLAGALNFFLYQHEVAEVHAQIHPLHRRAGVFSQLLSHALLEMQRIHVQTCHFQIKPNSKEGKACCRQMGARYLATLHRLRKSTSTYKGDSDIEVRLCERSELKDLVELDKLSFHSDPAEMKDRFEFHVDTPGREIFGCYRNNTLIGKGHIRKLNDKQCCLHDLCITPKLQHQGLGKQFLMELESLLNSQGFEICELEAESTHPQTMQFYLNNGYQIIDGTETWVLSLINKPMSSGLLH